MKRRLLLCALVILMLCGGARPAHADMAEVIDYIFGLSGPGGFFGFRYSQDVICWSVNRTATEGLQTEEARDAVAPQAGGLFNCYGTDKRRPLTTLSVAFEWAHTDANPFTYDPATILDKNGNLKDPAVDARLYLVSVDTNIPWIHSETIRRGLSVGGTLGFIQFSGSRFQSFVNPYLELPRLTISPFALFKPDPAGTYDVRKDIFRAKVMLKYLGRIDFSDFGAIQGTNDEHKFQVGVMFEANIPLNHVPKP
jgi:hypothetical protein